MIARHFAPSTALWNHHQAAWVLESSLYALFESEMTFSHSKKGNFILKLIENWISQWTDCKTVIHAKNFYGERVKMSAITVTELQQIAHMYMHVNVTGLIIC